MTDVDDLAQRTADRLTKQHIGVVVAAVRGDEVAVRGAGRTAVEGPPVTADTLFEIGSVTKVFTSLTLARLVLDGTVMLDEPVRDLLPPGTTVPSRDGREVTLRHLAMHTSGLPRLPHGMLWPALRHAIHPTPDPYAGCTAEVILGGLAATKLRAVPGARVRYSNLGVGLLGLALATRSGEPYESLVTAQVCAPLGLTDTRITLEPGEPRFAQGHTASRKPTPPWHLNALAGAGGLRSTGTDLVAFLRAHLDPDSALAEPIRLCLSQEQRFDLGARMHLGWLSMRPHPRLGASQVWHDGGTGGFRSFVGFVPGRGAAVVVLSNTARGVNRAGSDLLRVLSSGGDLKK